MQFKRMHLPLNANVSDARYPMPADISCAESTAPDTPELQLREFIGAAAFPCVGAKSALNKARLRFGDYAALADENGAAALCRDLQAFSAEFPDPRGQPASFIATFNASPADEVGFETQLWRHLQLMHELDRREFAWDLRVSANAADPDFSMSIAGRAFFIVGLHPHASRLARKAPVPCLVFNFHDQFVALKASGKYSTMQTAIRARDLALQGSVNPVLARFGESSEARQYSGRAVNGDWVCPFRQVGSRSP